MGKITRKVMMIGGSITPPNIPMDWTWRQMAAEAFWNTLKNCGVAMKDIDLVACNYNDRAIADSSPGPQIADALGILPKPVVPIANACAGNGIASYVAWNAIASGRCDIVVSMGFARSDNYDAMEAMNSQGNYVDYDFMLGMTHINYGSMRDAYYRQKYQVPLEAAGQWAYQCNWYARRNPLAANYNKPMPELEDLCQDNIDAERDRQATNRGGVASAMIFVGEEIAHQFTDKPVLFDVAYAFRPPYIGNFFNYPIEEMKDYDLAELPGLMIAAKEGYQIAGITPKDVDVVQVHDLTAYEGMMAIEAIGISEIGKGKDYILSGGMSLDSKCPINTYGGGPAFGHGSAGSDFQAGLLENFWQIRGECDERQVKDARIGVNTSYGTHHSLDVIGILQKGW
ncbi:MAG: thiolase family protein [Anaerolineaceae bacterium]|nr:thiolase family protein [Anaerolineaceae bacterium]